MRKFAVFPALVLSTIAIADVLPPDGTPYDSDAQERRFRQRFGYPEPGTEVPSYRPGDTDEARRREWGQLPGQQPAQGPAEESAPSGDVAAPDRPPEFSGIPPAAPTNTQQYGPFSAVDDADEPAASPLISPSLWVALGALALAAVFVARTLRKPRT